MTELWDWVSTTGWKVLVVWTSASLLMGLLVGRLLSETNPSHEEQE